MSHSEQRHPSHTTPPTEFNVRMDDEAPAGDEGIHDIELFERLAGNLIKRDEKQVEAFDYLRRAFVLRKNVFGYDSAQAVESYENLCTMGNSIAMKFLSEGHFENCAKILKACESLSEPYGGIGLDSLRLKMRAITMNNLGCYYKKKGKPRVALQYLDEALKIEVTTPGSDNPTVVHMNIASILSQLGRHKTALAHMECAYHLLAEEIRKIEDKEERPEEAANALPEVGGNINLVVICLHNMGVEHEFLGNYDKACDSYGRGYEIASVELGDGHALTQSLFHNYETSKKRANLHARGGGGGGKRGKRGGGSTTPRKSGEGYVKRVPLTPRTLSVERAERLGGRSGFRPKSASSASASASASRGSFSFDTMTPQGGARVSSSSSSASAAPDHHDPYLHGTTPFMSPLQIRIMQMQQKLRSDYSGGMEEPNALSRSAEAEEIEEKIVAMMESMPTPTAGARSRPQSAHPSRSSNNSNNSNNSRSSSSSSKKGPVPPPPSGRKRPTLGEQGTPGKTPTKQLRVRSSRAAASPELVSKMLALSENISSLSERLNQQEV